MITKGNLIKVAVLDIGVSLSHPDLKTNIKSGINIIDSKKSANDDNGHGSHVAGIIAALNNNIGVLGVAPNSSIYPVKGLDSMGNGNISNIIKGIFCTKGKIDLCAPGVDIYSTYTGTSYTTLSGTSMATPYVSGTVALLLSVPSKGDLNKDGNITPDEIFQRLKNTSVDLGQAGYDSTYGYGMVNAYCWGILDPITNYGITLEIVVVFIIRNFLSCIE